MENKIYNHPYFGEIYYAVNISEPLKGKENVPLLVFLHGAGERGRDFDKLKKVGIPKYIENGSVSIPCVTVCPQCPEGFVWVNLASMLKDFMEYIIEEYKIDRNRISLTGLSMGGYGTWEMAIFCPDLFRKVAPVCGGGTPWRTKLISADIWAFHGDKDTTVPPENSYMMVDAAQANGKNVKLTVFHNVAHNSWDEAYLNTKVLEWLTDI